MTTAVDWDIKNQTKPKNSLGHMETRPQLKVSSDSLVKPGIEPTVPGLLVKFT